MGTWGTAIQSNDTYADIYGAFFELYNEGLDPEEISEKLTKEHKEIIDDPDDCNNLWFALAKAQWECKSLDGTLLNKVSQIIESGTDIKVWRELGANERDIKKRHITLEKFLITLQSERPKAKSRKKKIIRQPVFEKGDCLAFKLANGNYGGAVVLEAIKDTEYGHNLIAATRINQLAKPAKKDFENSQVLIVNFGNWDNDLCINWYSPTWHKEAAHLIEKIDSIEVTLEYDPYSYNYGFVSDFYICFIEMIDSQILHEATKPSPKIKQTIKELTKK